MRDARIAMIYEGANGIQALDLVGRKPAANGEAAPSSPSSMRSTISSQSRRRRGAEGIRRCVEGGQGADRDGTMWLMQNGMTNFDNAGAASHDYLNLFGITALTYMWALQAKAALAAKKSGGAGRSYYDTKLATGRYFLARVLPDAGAHLAKVKSGAEPVMALAAEAF